MDQVLLSLNFAFVYVDEVLIACTDEQLARRLSTIPEMWHFYQYL